MIADRHDLIGWWDDKLHRTYRPEEAEAIFGKKLKQRHTRPAHLFPIFDSMTVKERAQAYGSPAKGDAWVQEFPHWDHASEPVNTAKCSNRQIKPDRDW